MTTLLPRAMTSNDLDAVFSLESQNHAYPWTLGMLRDCMTSGYDCQLLEQEREIMAFGIISTAAGESHLLNLVVSSGHQRRGLGRQLLHHLIDLAMKRHSEMMFLEVRASNEGAIMLYLEAGFSEIGQRRDYYPARKGRETAILMAMDLTFMTHLPSDASGF